MLSKRAEMDWLDKVFIWFYKTSRDIFVAIGGATD